jgi:hypothetical protein
MANLYSFNKFLKNEIAKPHLENFIKGLKNLHLIKKNKLETLTRRDFA